MSSFEDEERRAKYAVLPKSANHGKVVKLAPKTLSTRKETRTILPEEQYLSNLEKIIVKDYFPELPKLKAQAEYMDAQARNDVAKMRELQLRFHTARRTDRRTSPSVRPATTTGPRFDSPMNFDPDTPGPSRLEEPTPMPYANKEGDNEYEKEKEKGGKKKDDMEGLSVDGYLHKYTSEDNASFEELHALTHRREREKNKWLYDAAEKHNKEKVYLTALPAAADVQLAIRYNEDLNSEKPLALDNWTYTTRNTVLFHPEDVPLTAEEAALAAKRNQKIINKNATRFPDDMKNRPSEASMARAALYQAASNAGKVDAQGNEVGLLPSKTLGLVATPSPAPGIEDSPFMTWGEIDGTPFRLDVTDVQAPIDNAPAFKMPEVPYREQIAQDISDTISKRYREKRKVAMKTAEQAHRTPRFGSTRSSEKLAAMSPAARLLMKNKLGVKLSGSSKLFRTPTPSIRTPGSGSSHAFATPRTPISSMIKRGSTGVSSITDDLLPVVEDTETTSKGDRPTAGDFF